MKDKDTVLMQEAVEKIYEYEATMAPPSEAPRRNLYFVAKRGKEFYNQEIMVNDWPSIEELADDAGVTPEDLYSMWTIDASATPDEGSPIRGDMRKLGYDMDKITIWTFVGGRFASGGDHLEKVFIKDENTAFIPTGGRSLDVFFKKNK